MNKVFLFIDDEANTYRHPTGNFLPSNYPELDWREILTTHVVVIKTNYQEVIDYLMLDPCPDFISFDNDLGEEREGVDIVKWLIERDLDMSFKYLKPTFEYFVHSMNPVAKKRIVSLLETYLEYRKHV